MGVLTSKDDGNNFAGKENNHGTPQTPTPECRGHAGEGRRVGTKQC